jgi:1,3-propanediol dehydrogenase/alcohol dehydrogenase
MQGYRYLMPTEVFFGAGVAGQAGPQAARFGENALLVTGKRSSRSSGALDQVTASLRDAGLTVQIFDEVEENPSDTTTHRGADLARDQGCDVVVALGGGSPMDAAKGIAVLAALGGKLAHYYGAGAIPGSVLPILALPTTAGTGSEVTPYAVFVESEGNLKKTVASPFIFPRVALLDPRLTVSMPADITANTGIDALTHALEGFTSLKAQPFSDVLALEAIALINEHLPRAVASGQDLEARARVLHASMLAGVVIAQTGTTLLHGMGYAPTTMYAIPHGLANGVLMDQVMAFNGEESPQRYARLGEALDLGGGCASPPPADEALRALRERVGMPHRLRDLGVKEGDLEVFARQTMQHSRNLDNNIRRTDYKKVLEIYKKCY